MHAAMCYVRAAFAAHKTLMNLRNIAIIAHVDHGKTTLVDELLKQSGSFRENQRVAERAMDSNDLERERGITILAKCTSVAWKGTRINIVDTPGHADFGGEVERILNMVDGAIVLVDASEGPAAADEVRGLQGPEARPAPHRRHQQDRPPRRAPPRRLERDLRPLRQSRCHRRAARLPRALRLGPRRLDGARLRKGPKESLAPLFDLVLAHVPPPNVEPGPLRMLATTLEADPYLGRILTGRITSGTHAPQPAAQGAALGRQADRDVSRAKGAGLPRARARARSRRPRRATSWRSPA